MPGDAHRPVTQSRHFTIDSSTSIKSNPALLLTIMNVKGKYCNYVEFHVSKLF